MAAVAAPSADTTPVMEPATPPAAGLARLDHLIALMLAALAIVAAGVRFNNQLIGLTGDNAEYILLARALATGAPYWNAEYPWGYPALLAPFVWIFGPNNLAAAIPWIKAETILLLAGAVALSFYLFRLRLTTLQAAAPAFLFAVNSTALLYANDAMTEIPYAFASLGALLFWEKRVSPVFRAAGAPGRLGTVVAGAALLAIPFYLRTVGIALVAAGTGFVVFSRRWRLGLVAIAVMGALVLPWAAFGAAHDETNYSAKLLLRDPYRPELGTVDSPGEYVTRLIQFGNVYLTDVFPKMIMPDPFPTPVRDVLAALLALAFVAGIGICVRKGLSATELYALGFLLILFAWPWRADRFMLPVYPLLVGYVVVALVWLADRARDLRSRLQPAVGRALLVAVLLLVSLPSLFLAGQAGAENRLYLTGQEPPSGHTPPWVTFFEACTWLKEHAPPGSVVVSRKSTIVTLYTGLPSVLIPLASPEEYPNILRRQGVTYVMEDAFDWSTQTQDFLRPALAANNALFQLEFETGWPQTRIWRVLPPP